MMQLKHSTSESELRMLLVAVQISGMAAATGHGLAIFTIFNHDCVVLDIFFMHEATHVFHLHAQRGSKLPSAT